MSKVELVTRKSMQIRPSGRSTDFIAPSFGYGCLFNCGYCYMKRHMPEGLTVSKNIEDVLTAINHHSWFAHSDVEKPNQTHDEYITYDIGCNEDLALHYKYYDFAKIVKFFTYHTKALGSFATKYVNPKLLDHNPRGTMRIRFSLMPQKYAHLLEPGTSKIIDRIIAIDKFIAAGWDVHINFSPVIVTEGWEKEYAALFQLVDKYVTTKDKVKAEVIFLTHNADKHKYNLDHGILGEELLWRPDIQEDKVSQYGGKNIRYKHNLKDDYIRAFRSLHDLIIPWNTIRYIF